MQHDQKLTYKSACPLSIPIPGFCAAICGSLDVALCSSRLGQADLNPSQSTAMGNLASIVSLNSIAALQAHGAALQAHGIASLAQV